ncbi:amidohydrolase family protein [Microlunatus speluncae]|uniref:amidohydrolase family protein n=1 Tax=Microlunatus speluncae TaxID=2594267 RepID=UPI001C2CF231|nr:amidohydrolase family protein [Microlunatus speluncae]
MSSPRTGAISDLSPTPVFDCHVHLPDGETSLQAYRADVASSGIELIGLCGLWFGGPHQALAGEPAQLRTGNDGMITLAAGHPDLVPAATVHPYDASATDELTRVAGRGITVLKLHPHTQRFDAADPRVLTLVRAAGELGLTVLFDNAGILPGDSERLFNLALQAPKTIFIFAHLGGLNFRFWNVLALARTADDLLPDTLYFDLSATVVLAAGSPIEAEFVWTLRNVGIDRVLLGSDHPQFTLARTLEALDRLDLTAEEKSRIRHGNARRLFGR